MPSWWSWNDVRNIARERSQMRGRVSTSARTRLQKCRGVVLLVSKVRQELEAEVDQRVSDDHLLSGRLDALHCDFVNSLTGAKFLRCSPYSPREGTRQLDEGQVQELTTSLSLLSSQHNISIEGNAVSESTSASTLPSTRLPHYHSSIRMAPRDGVNFAGHDNDSDMGALRISLETLQRSVFDRLGCLEQRVQTVISEAPTPDLVKMSSSASPSKCALVARVGELEQQLHDGSLSSAMACEEHFQELVEQCRTRTPQSDSSGWKDSILEPEVRLRDALRKAFEENAQSQPQDSWW